MILSQANRKGLRLLSLMIVALLVSAFTFAFTPAVALAQAEETNNDSPFSEAVVTAETTANLNIRQGPGLEFEILETVPRGTIVGFTGFVDETGQWAQVDAAGGPVGWVSVRFLSHRPAQLQVAAIADVVQQTAAPAPVVFAETVVTANTTHNLNIRQGPGREHAIIDTLPRGAVVGFTGFTDANREWVQVDAGAGRVGWVAARFLNRVPSGLQVTAGQQ
jgi:uncharacterized protein YraI